MRKVIERETIKQSNVKESKHVVINPSIERNEEILIIKKRLIKWNKWKRVENQINKDGMISSALFSSNITQNKEAHIQEETLANY